MAESSSFARAAELLMEAARREANSELAGALKDGVGELRRIRGVAESSATAAAAAAAAASSAGAAASTAGSEAALQQLQQVLVAKLDEQHRATLGELARIREVAERQQRVQTLQTALAMARRVPSGRYKYDSQDVDVTLVESILMDAMRGEATELSGHTVGGPSAGLYRTQLVQRLHALTGIEPHIEETPATWGPEQKYHRAVYRIRL